MNVRRLFQRDSRDACGVLKLVSENSLMVVIYRNALYLVIATSPLKWMNAPAGRVDADIWRQDGSWQWTATYENDSLRYLDVDSTGGRECRILRQAGFAGRGNVWVVPSGLYTRRDDHFMLTVDAQMLLKMVKRLALRDAHLPSVNRPLKKAVVPELPTQSAPTTAIALPTQRERMVPTLRESMTAIALSLLSVEKAVTNMKSCIKKTDTLSKTGRYRLLRVARTCR